jgi:hypothetical protein
MLMIWSVAGKHECHIQKHRSCVRCGCEGFRENYMPVLVSLAECTRKTYKINESFEIEANFKYFGKKVINELGLHRRYSDGL